MRQPLTVSTECMKSQQCAPLKHHYDECAERVQQQQEENGKADEDCVEECKLHQMRRLFAAPRNSSPSICVLTRFAVFHLMHCASACAAPKLFAQLK